MRVSIIGGGNIAHSLSILLGKNNEVVVLTNNYTKWNQTIIEINTNCSVSNGTVIVSNCFEKYIPISDIIIITVPAFAKESIIQKIKPHFNKKTWIGAFPGGPHFDLLVKMYLGNDTKFFASQRVPFISRIIEYGYSVLTHPKDEIHIAFTKRHDESELINWMKDNLHIRIEKLSSFLQVTISNSNPILHPARLYTLFMNYNLGHIYNKEYLFYEEWNDLASDILIEMDKELHKVIEILDIKDLKLNTITKHYGVDSVLSMTNKITSINSFKGIKAPMVEVENGFIPDFDNRYFTEDFSFGLLVIKDFADLFSIQTPIIDKIINWANKFTRNYDNIFAKLYIFVRVISI